MGRRIYQIPYIGNPRVLIEPRSILNRPRPDRTGPLNGGRSGRVVVSAARPAELCGTGGSGRKQAPSHGGLTRPAALPPHPALGRASTSLLGGVLGGVLGGGHNHER